MSLAQRMMDLFRSSTRSYGVFMKNAKNSPHRTEHAPYTLKHFESHIAGKDGLGLVPICDDSTCWWGAVDIDAHGDRDKIDIEALYEEVVKHGLPLLVCRSKSGGAHLYLFMSEAIDAKSLRTNLRLMAMRVGYPDAEVFPKQDSLDDSRLGNWINLPYFDAKDTVRYCWMGKPITLEHFIETAESTRSTIRYVEEVLLGDHSEAPPCVQQMLSGKVPTGFRNEGLFAIATYMKQAYPDDWKDRCVDVNAMTFEQPLSNKEVKTLLTSVGRRDYKYRCKEEPCRSFCQSKVCLTRQFGIKPSDDPEVGDSAGMIMMEITGLTQVLTEPPVWYVRLAGLDQPIKVSTEQLDSPRKMKTAILGQAGRAVYPMKDKEWGIMLANALKELLREEAPEDASESGTIRLRLHDFLKKAGDDISGKDRNHIAHGQPVVMTDPETGELWVYFRGMAFVEHLRRTRASQLPTHQIWEALRNLNVETCIRKIGGREYSLWRIRYETPEAPLPPANVKSEF